jgi:hypothetical protein
MIASWTNNAIGSPWRHPNSVRKLTHSRGAGPGGLMGGVTGEGGEMAEVMSVRHGGQLVSACVTVVSTDSLWHRRKPV